MKRLIVFALAAGCASYGVEESETPKPDATMTDATAPTDDGGVPDAPPIGCASDAPFTTIEPLTELNTPQDDTTARLLPDERTIIFARGELLRGDVFIAARGDRNMQFGTASRVPELSSPDPDGEVWLTADALGAVMTRILVTPNNIDLFVATRPVATGAFSQPQNLASVNTPSIEATPALSADGTQLWFSSDRTGTMRLYTAVGSIEGGFTGVVGVDLGATTSDQAPVPSADGLTLYFERRNANMDTDIWRAERPTPTAAFGPPARIAELATTSSEGPSWISNDSCRLYFTRRLEGQTADLFVARREAR